MWAEFLYSILFTCLVLYLPGFGYGKAFKLSTFSSLLIAPVFSIAGFCLLACVYDFASLPCSFVVIVMPVMVLGLLIWLVPCLIKGRAVKYKKDPSGFLGKKVSCSTWAILAGYLFAGILLGVLLFVMPLNGADATAQTYDNVFHYNLIRSFADSGVWSLFHISVYDGPTNATALPIAQSGGFYPSAWHLICALNVTLLHIPVAVAANASLFVFVSVIFPSSICLLLNIIYKKTAIVCAGIFVVLAFGAFPWMLLVLWPLFPNLVSLCTLPIALACFIGFFELDLSGIQRVGCVVSFCASFVALGCLQPNAIFTAFVFLGPFVIYVASRAVSLRVKKISQKSAFILFIALFSIIYFGLWVILYKTPFLQATITYYWPPVQTVSEAICSVVNLSLTSSYPQIVLSILVAIGILYICIRRREFTWLIVSFVLASTIYIVAASFDDCVVKHFLAGFWYTDPYRVAAFVALFAIPLAAIGLTAVAALIRLIVNKLTKKQSIKTAVPLTIIIGLMISCVIYAPRHFIVQDSSSTMFGYIYRTAAVQYIGSHDVPYDNDERKFVDEIKEIVSSDDVVINHPYDGSLLAFGLDNLNTYYRSIADYETLRESEASQLIREDLDCLAYDAQVQQAVADINADYVLILENDAERMNIFFPTYADADWSGIEDINENTPGFDLVYQKGSMKLYKILAE